MIKLTDDQRQLLRLALCAAESVWRERIAIFSLPNTWPVALDLGKELQTRVRSLPALKLAIFDSDVDENDRIRELEAALSRMVVEHEEVECDTEGRYPSPDPGCIECTQGVTPDQFNTGLCAYHRAKELLAGGPADPALSEDDHYADLRDERQVERNESRREALYGEAL